MADGTTTPAAQTEPPPPSADPATAIEAEGLCKYYGQFTAVEDVSFTVPKGSITAFLGPNGAGKSTTMKILTGFLAPTAGKAYLAGHDMTRDRMAASRILGYLPENGPLYQDMSPSGFLRFCGRVRGMGEDALDLALDKVLDSCRLAEVWHKPIRKLSKGFRQRVGLAQAILHDPAVLILDEPTSGLDPNQIHLVRDLIRSLGENKTVLLSTHILQEVEAMADHVILISDGRVRFTGTADELRGDSTLDDRFRELTKGVAS
ncbi:MAG: ABC transporter ATP-binding protein [Planctomycetota bacterium]|jgi:ABC-2 type transport system ATP-binding protein|nr:ABC transporter ATP-binding protein [Planctomycetota bacterium]